jgi:hypothetical protein
LNRSSTSNIPERRLPRRIDLDGAGVETIHAGRSVKARLLRLDLGEGPMVVKDFGDKSWWVRLIGRLQIRMEQRAYRRLEGVEGVPRFFGRVGPYALAIEYVDGRPLGMLPDLTRDGPERFRRLMLIVSEIHVRGVVHWDLRARRNVLIRSDGRIFVVDFAGAMSFRPGGWPHRLLFRRFRSTDDSAILKWKQILEAGPLTEQENAFVQRHRRWRRWWIFNRKGGGRP